PDPGSLLDAPPDARRRAAPPAEQRGAWLPRPFDGARRARADGGPGRRGRDRDVRLAPGQRGAADLRPDRADRVETGAPGRRQRAGRRVARGGGVFPVRARSVPRHRVPALLPHDVPRSGLPAGLGGARRAAAVLLMAEFTARAVVSGILLGLVFGAANA